MQWLTKTAITKTYLIAILIVGMTFSSTTQFVLAIALLILNMYTIYKHLPLKLEFALLIGTILLVPFTLIQLTGSILPCLFALPAIYLLDKNLKEYAPTHPLKPQKRAREPTPLLKSALIALGAVLVASIMIVNVTLFISTAILAVYFSIIISVAIKVPKNPIQASKTWSRLLIGNTEKKTIQLTTLAKRQIYLSVTSLQPWVQVKQSAYSLKSNKKADIEVTFTPPLAGPTKIQLCASMVDTRGLIQSTQVLEPIELHVLPRAKYARWLAEKFLEHTGAGVSSPTSASPLRAHNFAKRSIEYFDNRPYQLGDRLKDVDWKHTFMIGELIVKEFTGVYGQPVFIVADLTAKDAQDADNLAYKTIMAALTAATESLPIGVVCFNENEVLVATKLASPRAALTKVLKLTEKITITSMPEKVMQPLDFQKNRQILVELNSKASGAESIKFIELLAFENETIQKIAKEHPVSGALAKCVGKAPLSAIIIVSSNVNGSTEAIAVSRERLRKLGHSIITI